MSNWFWVWVATLPIILALWAVPVKKFCDLVYDAIDEWWSFPLWLGVGFGYCMLPVFYVVFGLYLTGRYN
jgi:hypothetical protein